MQKTRIKKMAEQATLRTKIGNNPLEGGENEQNEQKRNEMAGKIPKL